METKSVPEELLALRARIDAIDDELVRVLARRFEATHEVGRLKAQRRLDSVDPERERQKLQHLGRLAEQLGLDAKFVETLFQDVFREVVKRHRSFLQ